MVKMFVSPEQGQPGTVSFQVFTLEWDDGTPRWESSSPSSAALIGKMLFVGRGCSRAIRTGRSGPAFIYFLDDADGSPDDLLSIIVSTDKEYAAATSAGAATTRSTLERTGPKGPRQTARHGFGSTIDRSLPVGNLAYPFLLEQILSDAM